MTYFFSAAILLIQAFTLFTISAIGRQLMSTQETIDALTAQVDKIRTEVLAAREALTTELDNVKAQLAEAGVAEQVDLTALTNAIQAVDDITPDA